MTPLKREFLTAFFEVDRHFFLTGGIEPAIVSWLLSQVHFESVPEYVFAPVTVAELNDFVARLRQTFADMSFPAPGNTP